MFVSKIRGEAMKGRKSIYTLASVYMGTVIGAGFASGQEIVQFFGRFQKLGILGVLLATLMFVFLGIRVLSIVQSNRIKDFHQFTRYYFGSHINKWITITITTILMISYYVMIAGGGAIIKSYFNIENTYGILLMSAICFITFTYGIGGITSINRMVVPALMIFILIISGLNIYYNAYYYKDLLSDFLNISESIQHFKPSGFWEGVYFYVGWIWSSILYVSFNSLSAVVIMSGLYPYIYNKKAAILGGIVGGVGLGLMALAIQLCLMSQYTSINQLDVPMMVIAQHLGSSFKTIYSILLWVAMYTTAIGTGFGCIKNISALLRIPERGIRLVLVMMGIPFALMGFKELIAIFYPLFGYVGIILVSTILYKDKISV